MPELEPVHLVEDADNGGRFLIYGGKAGPTVELRYEGDSLWMTQAQMAGLFGVTVASISRHILNIFEEGELATDSTVSKIETVRIEGDRRVVRKLEHYSLDMVISVGYRVSSTQATLFRRWATDKLVQFATKGFVIDSVRLKTPDARDRVAELREIVRDIRSDEANVYRELRQICSLCQDYDGSSGTWQEFYRKTQAKLVYSVTSKTPAEIIRSRADGNEANMGLEIWPNDNIRKSDVITSKNYLGQAEIKELNRLTDILLSIFEDQLDMGRLTSMVEATGLLDKNLSDLGRSVLDHGGSVLMSDAKAHAEHEYEKFKAKLKLARHNEADRAIEEVKQTLKRLRKGRD
jgi:hypothetical protein